MLRMCDVKRPYPRTAPCAVVCRGDGDKVSALIGANIMEGVCGFGDDLPSALRSLADELEREVGQVPIKEEHVKPERSV